MDIGKLKNNKMYREEEMYDQELVLSLKEDPDFNIHIWEGYIRDIFDKPPLHGMGWQGFTRDFNEFIGAFSKKSKKKVAITNLKEYFVDLLEHEKKQFRIAETREVFNLMVDFLRYAMVTGQTVVVQVV